MDIRNESIANLKEPGNGVGLALGHVRGAFSMFMEAVESGSTDDVQFWGRLLCHRVKILRWQVDCVEMIVELEQTKLHTGRRSS